MATSQSKALVINSGGMDSTTAVWEARGQGLEVSTISFNYGQRHSLELEYAAATATSLGLQHDVIDLSGLTSILSESGSSLVSDEEVPEGHYAEDNMSKTIVPNRNMMMISIAGAVAVSRNITFVVMGVHAGDHAVYPDCRPEFIQHAKAAMLVGNSKPSEYPNELIISEPVLLAPYVQLTKAEIAKIAIELKMPFETTYSCYKGGEFHCGRCGTCVERLEAIDEAEKVHFGEVVGYDQTEYADKDFWKEAVQIQRDAIIENAIANVDKGFI